MDILGQDPAAASSNLSLCLEREREGEEEGPLRYLVIHVGKKSQSSGIRIGL